MNTGMRLIRTLSLSVLMFGITTLVLAGPPVYMQDDSGPRTRATLYGLHSLAPGQTARLSVVNAMLNSRLDPGSDSEIIPCIRVKSVFDIYEQDLSEPIRLRFVRRVEREVTLGPGEAAAFEYTAPRAGSYVRASVFDHVVRECAPPDAVRVKVETVSTLEVREGGRTVLTAPWIRKGFDPQPDPPAQ